MSRLYIALKLDRAAFSLRRPANGFGVSKREVGTFITVQQEMLNVKYNQKMPLIFSAQRIRTGTSLMEGKN